VAQYNPDCDTDCANAKKLFDLLVDGLTARFEALASPPDVTASDASQTAADESVS
jgi:hypothetical protein